VLGKELVDSVIADHHSASIDEDLKAMLDFIEKLTLHPEELSAEDIDPLHEAGLSDEAIEDAIGVAVAFNLINRLADSFAWEIPDQASLNKAAKMMLARGYM
jgi:uncharacterized peroxidase-related enzyme